VRVAGRAGPGDRTGGGVPWRVLGALGVCLALFVPSWLADFREIGIREEVRPLILKENAVKLFGLAGTSP